jgi:hypothetical protein
MRLMFFDEPRRTTPPITQASHSANRKGSRHSKSEVRTDASPARLDEPADASPTTPQVPAPTVNWMAEGQRVARDYIARMAHVDLPRPADSDSTGLGLLRSRGPGHRLGDTEHFDGGEVIDWINDRCYYSNRDPNGNLPPMHGVTGLAPLYPTGKPICKPR